MQGKFTVQLSVPAAPVLGAGIRFTTLQVQQRCSGVRVGGGGGFGCSCCSVALVAPVPPFPFSVALCVVREKELREPVDGGPKTVMWCSEPAGDRWHCQLGPGTVSRSPGWAIGWTGQCSPAPQPWAVCPVEGGGGRGCISPWTGSGLMHDTVSTPAAGGSPGPVVRGSAPGHHPVVGG